MSEDRIFALGAVERIFDGELKERRSKKGKLNHYAVRGFRLEVAEVMARRGIEVNELSRTPPDSRGVYRAFFSMQGQGRCDGSFFPRAWTREQVLRAIEEAYQSRALVVEQQRIYEGRTREGIKVRLWLDEAGMVEDAQPVRAGKVSKQSLARFQMRRGLIRHSRYLCGECKRVKVHVCPVGHGLHAPIGFAVYVERLLRRFVSGRFLHGGRVERCREQ